MKLVIDIEANSLLKPTKIWLIVCKDIETDKVSIFREVSNDASEKKRFQELAERCETWIGHNILGYDRPVLLDLLGIDLVADSCVDTLIVSKLVDYSRQGHSIEDYGLEFGLEKIKFNDWTQWSQEMEDYCVRDTEICHKIYLKYLKILNDPSWKSSLELEHKFQLIVNSLSTNGFSFNIDKGNKLLERVLKELEVLDKDILKEFPKKLKMVREVHPKVTKHGTLSRTDFRWVADGDLSEYNGGPFCRCAWQEFNPSSHKQIIEVLHGAGWSPTDRTQTHIETERQINRLKYQSRSEELDLKLQECYDKLEHLKKYGWKVNETNLGTLPEEAPTPARLLAKRILLESRRRTLVEWLGLVNPDTKRIHGSYYGIGAWTHRMAHQRPNTANIPTDAKLYGGEMRSLWQAPRNRLLVGVDAEGIQLRIFAHYIDDKEFTDALVRGTKSARTDPHSLNKRILGEVCKDRQTAKRFVYALLLGAGIGKLAQILECSQPEAERALRNLMERYQGFTDLKENRIPSDARRGWFSGLDGRKVPIPGDSVGSRKHLCMSGYLQNGEAIIMKKACLDWTVEIENDPALKRALFRQEDTDAGGTGCITSGKIKFVNFVHDEWQTETVNNMEVALRVAEIQAKSIERAGRDLNLKCPLAGSYWNEDLKDYTIGTNWKVTH